MAKQLGRPKDEQELLEREVRGFWKAQALSTEIAEGTEKFSIEVLLRIHKLFFEKAIPEVAGLFRKAGEDVMDLECMVPPPGGRPVEEAMYVFSRELDTKMATIPKSANGMSRAALGRRNKQIIFTAVWAHHQITSIHPFCDGNGRMARIVNNMVLRRFGLQPSDLQHLGDNKRRYLDALCQIDRAADYEPLVRIILAGITETYRKVYAEQRKNAPAKKKAKR